MLWEGWMKDDRGKGPGRNSGSALPCLVLALSILMLASGCGDEPVNPVGPVTWWVMPTGQGDFIGVQECISAARDLDTCLVFPATYQENIDFGGKLIAVTSAKGPETTILDGQGLGPVVRFVNNEDKNSVLSGFTIRNGFSAASDTGGGNGAGIRMWAASPVISNCIIRDNYSESDGGGVYCAFSGSRPSFDGVVFQDNAAAGKGGGLYVFSGIPVLTNCLFLGNEARTGGAIGASYGAQVSLFNTTLVDNLAGERAGAEALYLFNSSSHWTDSICGHKDWKRGASTALIALDRDRLDPAMRASSPTSLALTNVDLEGGRRSIRREHGCLWGVCRVKNRSPVRGNPQFRPFLGNSEDPTQAYYLYQDPNEPAWKASPCVDSGSMTAEQAGMNSLTTQNGEYGPQQPDIGTVDLGYHYAIVVQ